MKRIDIELNKLTPETVLEALIGVLPKDLEEDYVIACIGTKKCLLDSFGPRLGSELKIIDITNVYGTYDSNIHALNVNQKREMIKSKYPNKHVLAIDACVGECLYKTIVLNKPVKPGSGFGKVISPIGNTSLHFIVAEEENISNINDNYEDKEFESIMDKAIKIIAEGIKMHKQYLAERNCSLLKASKHASPDYFN